MNNFDAATTAAKKWRAQAVLQVASPFFALHRKPFVALLTEYRPPAMCESRMFVVDGCLMTYGASFEVMSRERPTTWIES